MSRSGPPKLSPWANREILTRETLVVTLAPLRPQKKRIMRTTLRQSRNHQIPAHYSIPKRCPVRAVQSGAMRIGGLLEQYTQGSGGQRTLSTSVTRRRAPLFSSEIQLSCTPSGTTGTNRHSNHATGHSRLQSYTLQADHTNSIPLSG